jgi:hypothetical protein
VDRFIYHLLEKKGVPAAHPVATARLLQIVVRTSYEAVTDHGSLPKIIRQLATVPATHPVLLDVLNHMAARGSTEAPALKSLITEGK